MKKIKNKNSNDNNEDMPKWVRLIFILAVILYLLWILFIKSGIPRDDFPFFRK